MKTIAPSYCPALTHEEINQAMRDGRIVIDGGVFSRVCHHCGDAWPLETRFFQPRSTCWHGIDSVCRACRTEERAAKRREQKQMEAA